MNNKKKICKAAAFMLAAGMLASVPPVQSQAAVITSNATDKIAVVFQEGTAYSAGDYVIYGGEMYICTSDIQGSWNQAETSFMQITKNQELGQTEDLSAAYADSKDPSSEKSLMAFVANTWQKLTGFLGLNNRSADTDASSYKNASVSAKLNYLEQQNQTHTQNLATLQDSVTKSFQSVSNGKSLIADAITGKEGTASPLDTFQQLSQSIRDMGQAQYDKGYGAGNKDGYDTGYGAGNKDGYDTGYAAGNKDGYDAGVLFADGRVNKDSESYKQGLSEADAKIWTMSATLVYEGCTAPEGEEDPSEYFSIDPDSSDSYRTWKFNKDFGKDATILGIVAEVSYTTVYRTDYTKDVVVRTGDREFGALSYGETSRLRYQYYNSDIQWGGFGFGRSDNTVARLKLTVVYA